MHATNSSRGILRGQTVMTLLLLAAALGYGAICVHHGSWSYAKAAAQAGAKNAEKQGTDFTAFYSAGELARQGKNIYDWRASSTPRRPFIYPPMFALFPMLPLSLLPHDVALGVFYALNVLALAAALWMLRLMLWPPAGAPQARCCSTPMIGMLLTLAVSWRFIHANTIVGNANLLILFLIVLALFLEWRAGQTQIRAAALSERGHPSQIMSGIVVGLATAFKLTPGLFGVFFLWSWRRWAMLGGAGAGFVSAGITGAWVWMGDESKIFARVCAERGGKSARAPRHR